MQSRCLEACAFHIRLTRLTCVQAIEEWERFTKYKKTVTTLFDNDNAQQHDTVGRLPSHKLLSLMCRLCS